MISIVACCHSAKLCAHAAWAFRSQQNGAVTRMWKAVPGAAFTKECAIDALRCKKEGMMVQPLGWRCVKRVIHYERDVREEQQYIYVAWTSNNKRDCGSWSLLLLAATVRSFAHMLLGLSDRNSIYAPYISSCTFMQGRTQGGLGLNPSLELDILQKIYYLRKGD